VGDVVHFGALEITVLKAVTHTRIDTASGSYTPGDKTLIYLDLGVLVRNTGPDQTVFLAYRRFGVTEESGSKWYPDFIETKTVDVGTIFDPFSLKIADQSTEGGGLQLQKDTYLRALFIVTRRQTVMFRIQHSPPIAIQVGG
jgi:hypothetical protein